MKEKLLKICSWLIDFSLLAAVFLIPVYFAFFQELFNSFEIYKVLILKFFILLGWLAFLGKIFLSGSFVYPRAKKLFLFLGFLFFSWGLSSFFSLHPQLSLWGNYSRQQGLLTLIFYPLFFLLLFFNLKTWPQIRRLLAAALLSSFFVCLYGFLQFFSLDPLKWKEDFFSSNRIFSTLGQPNFLGHFIIIVLPLAVFYFFRLTKNIFLRSLLVLLFGLQIICLFFTSSRSAWLGLGAEIWLFIFIWLFFHGRRRLAIYFSIASLLVFIFFGAIAVSSVKNISLAEISQNRFLTIFDLNRGSNKMRLNYWQAAGKEFWQAPPDRKLAGFGPEALSDVFAKNYQRDWALNEKLNSWPDRAHNLFFDILLSFGLAGLAAYFLLFCFFAKKIILFFSQAEKNERYWLAVAATVSLAGYFVNNLFSFSLTAHYLYLGLLLGILSFLFFPEKGEMKISWNNFSRGLIFSFTAVFFGIFVFVYGFLPVFADHYYLQAKKSANGDCAAVLAGEEKAIGLAAGAGIFYRQSLLRDAVPCFSENLPAAVKERIKNSLAWCLEGTAEKEKDFYFKKYQAIALLEIFSDYRGAEDLLRELIKNYPEVESIQRDLALVKFRVKDFDGALSAAEMAEKKLPAESLNSPDFIPEHLLSVKNELAYLYELKGWAQQEKKNYQEALVFYESALKFDPHYLPVYKKIADIYYARGDLDKALWYNKKGYSLNQADYSWPFSIGLLLLEKGDKKEALDYFHQALKLSPDNPEIKKILAESENK